MASVGIELQNMTLGQSKYPAAQIESLIWLSKQIMKRHKILPHNVVGHSDVAPTRKVDPGVSFPWTEMAKHKLGILPNKQMVTSRKRMNTLLHEIGYMSRMKKQHCLLLCGTLCLNGCLWIKRY